MKREPPTLLMLRGERLEGDGPPPFDRLQMAAVEEATLSVKFAFRRDRWNQFDPDRQEHLGASLRSRGAP